MQMTYNLFKTIEWGETRWVIAAPGCSTFGRYTTQAAAKADAKIYKIRLRRAEELDSQQYFR